MQELWRVRAMRSLDVFFQVRSTGLRAERREFGYLVESLSALSLVEPLSPAWWRVSLLLPQTGPVNTLGNVHLGNPRLCYEYAMSIEGARSCSLTVLLDHRKIWGRMAKIFLGTWWES